MKKFSVLFGCLVFAVTVLVIGGFSKKGELAKAAAEEVKPAETQPAEPEKKAEELKPAETQPAEPEKKAEEVKPAETQPAEPEKKAEEVKPAETQLAESAGEKK